MKVIPSSEVPKLIKDGDSVLMTGITLGGFAEESVMELEKSFLETGHPNNMTFYWQAAVGDMNTKGLSHICHEGMMTKGIGGHLNGCGRAMTEFSRDNKAEIYNWPQGRMCRYAACNRSSSAGRYHQNRLKDIYGSKIRRWPHE